MYPEIIYPIQAFCVGRLDPLRFDIFHKYTGGSL